MSEVVVLSTQPNIIAITQDNPSPVIVVKPASPQIEVYAGTRGPQGQKGDPGETIPVGVDKTIQYNDGGVSGGDPNFRWDKNTKSVFVGLPDILSNSPVIIGGALDDYLQISIQNTSESANASSDIVATADSGNDDINFLDMGINSSVYNVVDDPSGPLDSYIAANGGDLFFFVDTDGMEIKMVVQGEHVCTVSPSGLIMETGKTISDRPPIFYGVGSPPSPTGLPNGALFFKYTP